MFYREISKKLESWKKGSRKPLIVSGLRKVGKTTTILDFCKRNYENVVYIDFESDKSYSEIFEGDFDIDRITSLLSTKIDNISFVPNKTIIFFDEIQESANARASLKYFYLDKRYDVICSASFLGVRNYNQNFSRSVPVGFETFLTMYPLNFKEFLIAMNKKLLITYIEKSLENLSEIEPFVHNQLLELFRSYLIIGGMPEIISRFIETRNYDDVFKYQKDLFTTYTNDFSRFINSQNIKIKNNKLYKKTLQVYESIPNQLVKGNNKFQYSFIKKGARASSFNDAIKWLIESGLVYKVNNVKFIKSPLSFYQVNNQFKLYFADTGLLYPSYGKASQDILLKGNKGVNEGSIYENAICSLLIRKEYIPYYYSKTNRLEIDFVIENNENPIALEVKATNSKSKSLNTIATNQTNYGSNDFICLKFYEKNISVNKDLGIINLPYYLIDFFDFNNFTKEKIDKIV